MSSEDVARVREEVRARLRAGDEVAREVSLRALVADTLLDVLDLGPEDPVTDHHRLIIHLVTQGLERARCKSCHGDLIGLERGYDTCGHCGGRFLNTTIGAAAS